MGLYQEPYVPLCLGRTEAPTDEFMTTDLCNKMSIRHWLTAPAPTYEGAMCREACYKGEGFWDPFKPVKDEENSKALKLLPGVLKCVCTSTL